MSNIQNTGYAQKSIKPVEDTTQLSTANSQATKRSSDTQQPYSPVQQKQLSPKTYHVTTVDTSSRMPQRIFLDYSTALLTQEFQELILFTKENYSEIHNLLKSNHQSIDSLTVLNDYQESNDKNNPLDMAKALNDIGKAYVKVKKENNILSGLRYFQAAHKIQLHLLPKNHQDVIDSLLCVGQAYVDLGGQNCTSMGIGYQKDALRMQLELPNEGVLLTGIGIAYDKLDLQKQLQYFTASLVKINMHLFNNSEKFSSPSSKMEIGMLLMAPGMGLMMGYEKLGGEAKIKTDLQYQEDSLKLYQNLFSENDEIIVIALNNLGFAYQQLGGENNIKEALKHYETSLEKQKKLSSCNEFNITCVAQILFNSGVAYMQLKEDVNIRKGLQYCEAFFEIKEKLLSNTKFFKEKLGQPPFISGFDITKANESLLTAGIDIDKVYTSFGGKEKIQKDLQHQINCLQLYQELLPDCKEIIAASSRNIGKMYLDLGKKNNTNINHALKYLENSLRAYLTLGSMFYNDIFEVLLEVKLTYFKLYVKDNYEFLEYAKQVYGIATTIIEGGDEILERIKLIIDYLQPKFFTKQGFRKPLSQEDCFGGTKVGFECRWIIFSRGEINDTLLTLKQKIQKNVLNRIVEAVDNNGWSDVNFFGTDYGVKGYLEKAYLEAKVGCKANIEVAEILCFESMNLGIMLSEKKPYSIVQEFTRKNPQLVKKIAQQHPEFFVDGSIVEACVKSMPNDSSFGEHIFKHVKYMGMEERRKRGF